MGKTLIRGGQISISDFIQALGSVDWTSDELTASAAAIAAKIAQAVKYKYYSHSSSTDNGSLSVICGAGERAHHTILLGSSVSFFTLTVDVRNSFENEIVILGTGKGTDIHLILKKDGENVHKVLYRCDGLQTVGEINNIMAATIRHDNYNDHDCKMTFKAYTLNNRSFIEIYSEQIKMF